VQPRAARAWPPRDDTVGQLQLEALTSRLEVEYKVEAQGEASPYDTARGVVSDDAAALTKLMDEHEGHMATDRDNHPVFRAKDLRGLNDIQGRHPAVRFSATRERR
jgi:peptide chain release factor 3